MRLMGRRVARRLSLLSTVVFTAHRSSSVLADINLKIRVANIPVAALTQIKVLIAFARPTSVCENQPSF
jgi:hypothetical protein